jgi:hypothetical protein
MQDGAHRAIERAKLIRDAEVVIGALRRSGRRVRTASACPSLGPWARQSRALPLGEMLQEAGSNEQQEVASGGDDDSGQLGARSRRFRDRSARRTAADRKSLEESRSEICGAETDHLLTPPVHRLLPRPAHPRLAVHRRPASVDKCWSCARLHLALSHGPAHLDESVRPGARLKGHVEMLKARLAVAEAVDGAGDRQVGEGSRRVLRARGRATSALVAAAHGLRLALPGAFPSTTPPRLFDQPSYPPKTPRSQAGRSRASASPRSRPRRSRAWSAATRGQAVVSGETWACGAV